MDEDEIHKLINGMTRTPEIEETEYNKNNFCWMFWTHLLIIDSFGVF